MPKRTTVPISMRALIQRINRKLVADNETLKVSRGGRAEQDLGRYFIVDVSFNGVVRKNVDPEALGRELGVLHEYEHVAEEA